VLTLTPGKYVPSTTLFSYDKLGHAGIFCIQAFLLMQAFYRTGRYSRQQSMWSGFGMAVLYGLAIEFIQNLIPDRGMELFDALANTAGSFLALILFILLNRKKNTESV
jgi:VanZ family protein